MIAWLNWDLWFSCRVALGAVVNSFRGFKVENISWQSETVIGLVVYTVLAFL